jgi:hypothetical protein
VLVEIFLIGFDVSPVAGLYKVTVGAIRIETGKLGLPTKAKSPVASKFLETIPTSVAAPTETSRS